ncbi:hypothetical protein C0Q70_00005 [Pomacea canaliculata]|uniref:Protein kinase domain-containing protein n=2 Tax=Pomacea canaliculata TaxID=400727 RepID=A0A2T7PVF7_POMCA|nr:hypothetical protein C0Q70_00005 [Pomacea canaliculata]
MDDPLQIYAFMFDQNIGCALAALYEEWAGFLERLGHASKADQIYLEGIKREAQPIDLLKHKHQEFQIRMIRGMSRESLAETEEGDMEEQRIVLGQLKADRKNRVGTMRTGAIRMSATRSQVGLQSASQSSTQVQRTVQVFQDENQAPSLLQTGEWKTVPCREQTNRENDLVPDIWTKARVHQKKGVISCTPAPLTFKVHEDQEMVQPPRAPVLDTYALSSRKVEKPVHLLDPICKSESSNVERPAYCKDKIYCGTQEFSFEEIRALRVMERRRQKKLQEERDLMEKQLAEMRLMRDQMCKDMERMKEEALLLNQRQPTATHCMQLQLSAQDNAFHSSSSSSFNTMDFLSSSLMPTRNRQSLRLSQISSTVQVGAPSGHASTQLTPIHDMLASDNLERSCGSGTQFSLHQSHSDGRTPENNTSKHSLHSVSPTINTREALQMVQGMYNATLDCEKMVWTQEDITEATAPVPPVPVEIYDETKQNPSTSSIPIFCDQENRLPGLVFSQIKKDGPSLNLANVRKALPEKPMSTSSSLIRGGQFNTEDFMQEGTELYNNLTLTLAPVGSQDSFSAAARLASTPFGPSTNNSHGLPTFSLDSSKSIDPGKENGEMWKGKCHTEEQQSVSQCPDPHQQQTFLGHRTTAGNNHLSPITEGSTEGSTEESKSHAASSLGGSRTFFSTLAKTSAGHDNQGDFLSMTSRDYLNEESTEQHIIDTTAYIPLEQYEKAEALLSTSVCLDTHNPFDEATTRTLLSSVQPPISCRANYIACHQHVPNFSNCHFINLGEDTYQLAGLIGEGGFAKVYRATNFGNNFDDLSDDEMDSPSCVIKVQKPAAPWEFYICSVVHEQLSKLQIPMDIRPSLQEITHGYFYDDGSCLVSELCPLGSLLTLANSLKQDKKLLADLEPLAAFLAVQLLNIVHGLHRCNIIHGDIKPDNILLLQLPQVNKGSDIDKVFGHQTQVLRLVDFGQAIDMSLYPPGTTFLAKVKTSGFQCIEMMTDRPWTFQTDMFGLVGSLHVLIFGQYMKVYSSQGHWYITSSFQRKWKVDLWKKLFYQLLNIPDCDHQPDLLALSHQFQQHFVDNLLCDFRPLMARVTAVCQADSL